MQANDLSKKTKVLVDGENIPGLVTTSDIKDEEGEIDVPTFGRKTKIKDGVKTFDPIELKYKVAKDTNTQKTFYDWFNNNEYHDVTIVHTDATGQEIDRWLLRDCECKKYAEGAYDAGAVSYFGVEVTIICTTTPIRTAT